MYKGKVTTLNPDKGFGFLSGVDGNAFFAFSLIGTEAFSILKQAHVEDAEVGYEAELRTNRHGAEQYQVTKVLGQVTEEERGFEAAVLERLDAMVSLLKLIHAQYED